jgi:hypothetical protein
MLVTFRDESIVPLIVNGACCARAGIIPAKRKNRKCNLKYLINVIGKQVKLARKFWINRTGLGGNYFIRRSEVGRQRYEV